MRWQIEPLVGLGPLKLGMTRLEVGTVLDPIRPVEHFDDAFGGGKREFRGLGLPVVSYDGDEARGYRATGFDADYRVRDVHLDDFDIFDHPSKDVLRFLEHKNGGALEGLGSVLFLGLGINSSGFYDAKAGAFFDVRSGEQDERDIAIFAHGAFDKLLGSFTPISFGPP